MSIKDIEQRKNESSGREETEGIPKQGFYDANAEFPLKDYKNSSSINKAARGLTTNEINVSGGDPKAPIETSTITESIYSNSQVQETASGHIIEIDDTIGNERVMIKHRSGSGVELRPDGSIIASSIKNTVQISNADHTVIVEGNGKLVYKGNLDLNVSGDLNLNVGGDFNVTTGGDKNETVKHNSNTYIIQDELVQVKGDSTKNIEDSERRTVGGSVEVDIKYSYNIETGVNYNCYTGGTFSQYGKVANIYFPAGAIGGPAVDLSGNTCTFFTYYGSLVGNASTSTSSSSLSGSLPNTISVRAFTPISLASGTEVSSIDSPYTNVFGVPYINYTPTTAEARAILRSSVPRNDFILTSNLTRYDIISSNYNASSGYKTNRRTSKTNAARKGETALGSNPPTIDKKSFKW